MEKPVDIYMWVGSEYSVKDIVTEYSRQGISKRIPLTAIPNGIEPGRSRLFVGSKKAIVEVTAEGKKLFDLLLNLIALGAVSEEEVNEWYPDDSPLGNELYDRFWDTEMGNLQPNDPVPEPMLELVMALDSLKPADRKRLEEELELAYHGGVVGYGYIDCVAYVCKDGEDDLPENLQHLQGTVTPVKVLYEEGGNEQDPAVD